MFIVVTGRGTTDALDAGLYDHAERLATATTKDGLADRWVALVRTANDRYLTDYQAARLGSFPFGTKVFETFDEAVAAYVEAQTYELKFHKPIDTTL